MEIYLGETGKNYILRLFRGSSYEDFPMDWFVYNGYSFDDMEVGVNDVAFIMDGETVIGIICPYQEGSRMMQAINSITETIYR